MLRGMNHPVYGGMLMSYAALQTMWTAIVTFALFSQESTLLARLSLGIVLSLQLVEERQELIAWSKLPGLTVNGCRLGENLFLQG